MKYTFDYPQRARAISGRRGDTFMLNMDHLAQTHDELMDRIDDPNRTVMVQASVDATSERVWAVAGSPARLFSHQPRFAGLSSLDMSGILEGGRYVIHRVHEDVVFNRVGEVLIYMPGFQLTVSDIDIADTSVSGKFPSLFTVRVEEDPADRDRTLLQISYTTLGVMPPLMPAVLLLQLKSIQERAEEASLPTR
jgi:hypothetical protein